MARIYIGGAGGAPSNGFIRSLRESARTDYLIGASSSPTDLFLANTDEIHPVPTAKDARYASAVTRLWQQSKPDFIHVQHDYEVRAISQMRETLNQMGIRYFLPDHEVIENCVNKLKSYYIWKAAGIPVAETIVLKDADDLSVAFKTLGPKIWLRATEGAGGSGALPTDDPKFAEHWITHFKGWGHFTASRLLSKDTVTWLSIWHRGELVVAQGRKRLSWNFGDRTLSGVTGVTGVGQTCSDPLVDRIAQDAVHAIDKCPHGVFGVDMTYDFEGRPHVTEINIGRFFTTHYFFTKAGLNMPEIYTNIALDGVFPSLPKRINPLPDDLLWIRGMDSDPVLIPLEKLKDLIDAHP